MKLSNEGIALLKRFEGCRLKVYKDSAGLNTIGIGHLLKPGETFKTITMEQAESLLKADIAPVEAAINEGVKVPLTQNQFDSLVCLVFNIGSSAFRKSTLLRLLNEGDYTEASHQFLRWNRAGGREIQGLTNRRRAERALFLKPDE